MTPEQKLIQIVDMARGDNLERARVAFGRMSPTELDQQWGHSGQTCRQILKDYEDERELYDKTKKLLLKKLSEV